QPLPVARGHAGRLRGKTAPEQRGEQEVAAPVPGEDPPGPVAAVRGRSQTDDEDAGLAVAPAGDRPPPVRLRPEPTPLYPRQAPPRGQARPPARRAERSASPPADPARSRTAAASSATGVSGVAGSSGHPDPGRTCSRLTPPTQITSPRCPQRPRSLLRSNRPADGAGLSLQPGAKVAGCPVGSLRMIPGKHVPKAVLG